MYVSAPVDLYGNILGVEQMMYAVLDQRGLSRLNAVFVNIIDVDLSLCDGVVLGYRNNDAVRLGSRPLVGYLKLK